MATPARLARRPKARPAAPKAPRATLNKLYEHDFKEYFRKIKAGEIESDEDNLRYAGFRAWLDGYNAGRENR